MNSGNGRFTRSVSYALSGIRYGLSCERNMKLEFWIAISVLTAEFFVRSKLIDVALTELCIAIVLCAELLNTAVEIIVGELTHGEWLLWAKKAKDLCAGAVLMVSMGTSGIGIWAILQARPWHIYIKSFYHPGGMILAACGLAALFWLRYGVVYKMDMNGRHEN